GPPWSCGTGNLGRPGELRVQEASQWSGMEELRFSCGYPFQHPLQGCIDALPFGEQLPKDLFACVGEDIEALVALVFFPPFADQQALGLEAPKEGIEGALVDGHTVLGKGFAEGVAVLFGVELGQDGEDERAAAELEAKVLEEEVLVVGHSVWRILCCIHCMKYTVWRTVRDVKGNFWDFLRLWKREAGVWDLWCIRANIDVSVADWNLNPQVLRPELQRRPGRGAWSFIGWSLLSDVSVICCEKRVS